MNQKRLNPNNEFGPAQSQPASGNKEASRVAALSEKALERVKLSDLPTKEARLLALADAIENDELAKEEIGFNMAVWNMRVVDYPKAFGKIHDQLEHSCKTVACLAGWTDALENGPRRKGSNDDGTPTIARQILGITSAEARCLFYGDEMGRTALQAVTAKRAVAVLRDFAESGKVRWHYFNDRGKKIV